MCVLGSGAQWDVLQIFAWAGMIVDHARTMSVSAAVSQTFDGEMCSVCRLVQKAKQQEQPKSGRSETAAGDRLLLFSHRASALVLAAPRLLVRLAEPDARVETCARQPAVPPPRAAAKRRIRPAGALRRTLPLATGDEPGVLRCRLS